MSAKEKVSDKEIIDALYKEFEDEFPTTINCPNDMFDYERNMLRFVLGKAKILTQKKIDSLGTCYEGTTVKKNENINLKETVKHHSTDCSENIPRSEHITAR